MPEYSKSYLSTKPKQQAQEYLASVSDLMSLLLFIFIITIFVFVLDFQDKTNQANIEKEQFILAEQQTKKQLKELSDAREIRSELMYSISSSLLNHGIKVQVDSDRGILHLPEDILFPSGKATFASGGEHALDILSMVLAEKLPCYSGLKNSSPHPLCESEAFPGRLDAILIEGHTDNIPIHGIFEDNWHLSSARSLKTFQFIRVAQPILETLLNAQNEPFLGVSAYGETRPVQSNLTEEGRKANRRIDIRFVLAIPESSGTAQ